MANQGHWQPGDEATLNRLNSNLVQTGVDASKDGTLGDTGRLFVASDTKKIYRDSGSAWVEVILIDQAAAIPSMRTLGTNSTQASAGNHTHT